MLTKSPIFSWLASARGQSAILAAVVALGVGGDLWAVLQDRRPGSHDTFTLNVTENLMVLMEDRRRGAPLDPGVYAVHDPKGILPAQAGLLISLLVGDPLLSSRLVSVLAHGAMILLCFALARLLGRGEAGLWAALITATFPFIFGWSRLDFHEPLMTALVLAALLLMARGRLKHPSQGILLGLTIGLAGMAKVAAAVFLLVPGFWFLARQVRGKRAWLSLALGVAVCAALIASFIWAHIEELVPAFTRAQSMQASLMETALTYLKPTGAAPLLGFALASAALLAWRRAADLWLLVLFALFILVPLAVFIFVFDPWTRYVLPIFPGAAILAGAGIAWLRGRLRPPWSAAAGGVLIILLLGQYVMVQSAEEDGGVARELYLGMLTPDVEPYSGLARGMALVGTRSREVCVIFDSLRALGTSEGRLRLAKLRGSTFRRVPWERCKARRKRGLPAAVLFIQAYPGAGIGPGAMPAPESGERGPQRMNSPEGALAVSWLMAQKGRVVLGQHRDPDGKNYAALWLTGAK